MKYFFLYLFILHAFSASSQSHKTENIIIVTLDGMRWQEIFGGVDSSLLNNPKYTHEKKRISELLWSDDTGERRKKLLPFLWTTVAQQGQLYGNRDIGNEVNNANPYWF